MKKQEIISVLYELHKITGFRMSLHDVDYAEIAAYPPERLPLCERIHKIKSEYDRCLECDKIAFETVLRTKETMIYKCRYGLTEAVSPLYNFGILTGFLMMGQISDGTTDKSKTKDELIRVGISEGEAELILSDMTTVSPDMINSFVKIMTICAQYLTLSNAIPAGNPSIAENAKKFIHENINKKLTIKNICDHVGCSKTTLISAFKREFGQTVNATISKLRLEEAKRLLDLDKSSINDISQAAGFYDQSYFSKVFSKEYGITPSEYRKERAK